MATCSASTFSDTSSSQVAYSREVCWGTTEASALQDLRMVSESLNYNLSTTVSAEIRSDGNIPDIVPTELSVDGDISFELTYGTFDEFIEGGVRNEFVNARNAVLTSAAATDDFVLVAAANTITFGATVTHEVVKGDWITIAGAGSATNQGNHYVINVVNQVVTVASVPGIETDETLDGGTVGTISVEKEVITAAAATSDITLTLNTITLGAGISHNIVEGQYIKLEGFPTPANNVTWLVGDVTAQVLTVTGIADEGGATVAVATITGSYVRNANDAISFTLEKEFSDVTEFQNFSGMRVGTMSLDTSAGAIVTGTFGFQGKTGTMQATTVGTGTPIAATSSDLVSSSNNIGTITSDQSAITDGSFSALNFSVDNGLRGQSVVGSLAKAGIGKGRFNTTGTLTAYFQNSDIFDLYVNQTGFKLHYRITDADDNAYLITFPNVKFSSGTVVAGGIDADVMAEMNWQALLDPATGCALQIDRLQA